MALDADVRSDTEDDDVDFWGGESPSMLHRATHVVEDDEELEDEEEDMELMDDELLDDVDDDDDDEADDHMEIFGHL
jgi:hypothetical protein